MSTKASVKPAKKGAGVAPNVNKKNTNSASAGSAVPKVHFLTVEETDGSTFITRSTYPGDFLRLEISTKDHPAWNKGAGNVNSKDSDVAKFKNKFGDLDL